MAIYVFLLPLFYTKSNKHTQKNDQHESLCNTVKSTVSIFFMDLSPVCVVGINGQGVGNTNGPNTFIFFYQKHSDLRFHIKKISNFN